ncbi:hypothetical protein ACIQUX_18040 [Streptomyces sp. NPDC101133]|uniref:hypothetical protein n=1 Tax=Streptomyces sp. NPDC101133 TaxID=3366111 RepID=UPI00381CC16B
MEFDVLLFGKRFWYGRSAERMPQRTETVVASFPPTEVAEMRRSLEDLRRLATDNGRHAECERLSSLMACMETAETVEVPIPVDVLQSVKWSLGLHSYRAGLSEESVRALNRLRHCIDQARPLTGPWPRVRDTLQDALREALSRPGAEGLTARDELLDLVRRFADIHRTATAADDVEQRRLQAEPPNP